MEEKNTWQKAWLSYKKRKDIRPGRYFEKVGLCGFDGRSMVVQNALEELKRGVWGFYETEMSVVEAGATLLLAKRKTAEFSKESFHIYNKNGRIYIEAADENGLLYGVFHLLRLCGAGRITEGMDIFLSPDNPLRMLNHWDNMDGSIERGYSGRSFFFSNNRIAVNERTKDYARLAASIGINGVVINNVNVKDEASFLITEKHFESLAALSKVFAGYGIRLFLSLNFASPMELGGLGLADPLNEQVKNWWEEKMQEVFARIPNLGGFLVKADSEGRPGPFTYGRTQADGANMLADIVKKYDALIIWRCFVYNCTQDWRDRTTDRAKAGYDSFIGMDGDYRDNVILQIKNGPIDFQVREPVSPLLGGLKKTNQMLEVQAAQEYTGQQIDLCYLIPMFKEVLGFHTCCAEEADTVADIVSGRTFGNRNAGIAAVANTGNDANWTGSVLAAANFYGFGRLAFSTGLSAEEIAKEWVLLTISEEEAVVESICRMLLASRETYEKYTSPLGVGFMVTPHYHYGPNVDGYEYSRWGTYHRADHQGIGVDRSSRGTGYTQQYHEPNASMYDKACTCPENLLLFFHHLPYSYRMKDGSTLLQHIYDTHFEGVAEVEEMIREWEGLKESIPAEIYENGKERFAAQLANAKEWRDQINSYFYRKTGIPDEQGRTIY
ncbi:MAG: alpha-glucuronidase [Lachnospiraceae bacterium]|nr:alpha-glucuronidase [Lachnospiraceae bacterium]